MEHAVDFLHPLKKMKSLSPTASSYTSSHSPKNELSNTSYPSGVAKVVTIVAPVSLAILCRSPLSTLLIPSAPASTRYLAATSSSPIFVKNTLAPAFKILSILSFRMSSYRSLMSCRLLGLFSSTCTPICILNLLKLKSRQAILAFLI